ncbi:hypothetical protein LAN32_23915, partial [Mycobacterium tuberculosis]|nr:hypothetical protein [Mycobacterium tuberculosis]
CNAVTRCHVDGSSTGTKHRGREHGETAAVDIRGVPIEDNALAVRLSACRQSLKRELIRAVQIRTRHYPERTARAAR